MLFVVMLDETIIYSETVDGVLSLALFPNRKIADEQASLIRLKGLKNPKTGEVTKFPKAKVEPFTNQLLNRIEEKVKNTGGN